MEKKVRCALYVRCSTTEQKTDLQVSELEEFAHARGWTVAHTFEDAGWTGTNTNRPKFQEMLKAARARKFDILVVWKLDRFARSLKDLVTHLQELTDLGVGFVSLKDNGIDLTTPTGRLLTHLLSAFAEFEASIIRERVRSGIRAKIAKTGKWGPERKRDEKAILALRGAGLSVRQIARQLGISSTSVARAIKGVPDSQKKSVG